MKTRKLLSIVLSLVMVLSLSVPTFAVIQQDFAGGMGTEASPFIVANGEQLKKAFEKASDSDLYFKLNSDVDLYSIEELSRTSSTNIYIDGTGHKISNTNMTLSDTVIFRNVSFENCEITGDEENIAMTNCDMYTSEISGNFTLKDCTLSSCTVSDSSFDCVNTEFMGNVLNDCIFNDSEDAINNGGSEHNNSYIDNIYDGGGLYIAPVVEEEGTEQSTAGGSSTNFTYTGKGNEAYTVTVPAELAPGGSSTVVLEGTWQSNRVVTVDADATVTLKNSISQADEKELDITFDGIELVGDNTKALSTSKTISVANIEKALFGTWSGAFNYQVAIADVAAQPSNTLTGEAIYEGEYDGYTFVDCTINGGMFKNSTFSGTTTIRSGFFDTKPSDEYIADGRYAMPNNDPATQSVYQFFVGAPVVEPV